MIATEETAIELKGIWKKYSKAVTSHNTLREDIISFLKNGFFSDTLKRDEFWVLKDFNLTVRKGEAVGLYGPNGSGKSTILKLIAKITYPDRGRISVNGKVAPLIEIGAGFHPDLTGRENIYMNGAILGMTITEIRSKMDRIIEFSGVREFIDMPVKKYSSGMYLRLAFSVAIHSDADIYLFDEILAVGDETFREKCYDVINGLRKRGKTMVIVSHNKQIIERMTDWVLIMNLGKCLHS